MPTIKQCGYCGSDYKVRPSHAKASRYCSKKCKDTHRPIAYSGVNAPSYKNAGAKTCLYCGGEYKNYDKSSKYCSHGCAQRADVFTGRPKGPGKIRNGICKRCAFKYKAPYNAARDMCPTCRDKKKVAIKSKRLRTCVICAASFESKPAKKTCSAKCSQIHKSERQKGEMSHRWQGGKTESVKILRNSLEYKQWRDTVFERDGFTCCFCLRSGVKLAAHHIKPFSTHRELALSIENGIALCWECHWLTKGKEADYEAFCYGLIHVAKVEVERRGVPYRVVESVDEALRLIGAIR